MMGSQASAQERLFYSFNLDDHIPSNHLLRGVDRFLDLDELREHLRPRADTRDSHQRGRCPLIQRRAVESSS
jgi:hypothetical protein